MRVNLYKKTNTLKILCFTIVCFLSYVPSLNAEDYIHDDLYLRWVSGVGYGDLFETIPSLDGPTRKYSLGYVYSYRTELAIGYTFLNSFIPHLTFFHSGTIDSQINSGSPDFYLQGWGLGFTYYFMPINIFISFTSYEITSGRWRPISANEHPNKNFAYESNPQKHSGTSVTDGRGGGLRIRTDGAILNIGELMIGKEFWLSPEHSVGIALFQQSYHFTVSNAYKDIALPQSKYSYVHYGINFVLTYN